MSVEVLAAFDGLLEAIQGERERLADAVREATLQGRFAEARQLLAQTEKVEHIAQGVRQLREAWQNPELTSPGKRTWMARKSTKLMEGANRSQLSDPGDEDSPELAMVEQLFGGPQLRRRGRRQAVHRTPTWAYRTPILEALEQLGGRGQVQEVLNLVYEKMEDLMTEDDLKPLPSTQEDRWRNAAQWARQTLVNEGLLRHDSPRGVWEMTDAGRAYLEQVRQQRAEGEEP